jgi:hypothetical protein
MAKRLAMGATGRAKADAEARVIQREKNLFRPVLKGSRPLEAMGHVARGRPGLMCERLEPALVRQGMI